MDGRQRRFLCILTAMALACAAAQALTGVAELTLYLTPLFLIAALLLAGHYVAEEKIVERWRGRRPHTARMARTRWVLGRELALASALARSPRCMRGPPAPQALAS